MLTSDQNPAANNQPSFAGIIFDFNGVLLWDQQLQEEAWNKFAFSFRGSTFSEDEFAVHVHGRNMAYTLEYLAARALETVEVHRLGEEKESLYRQLCLDQGPDFRLSPGAVELLDFLAINGIKRTIATASGRNNLDFFIEHLELERWFVVDRIVYDNGTQLGKPAPDYYLQAAANLELQPAQCVVVEDSRSGLKAAAAAGIGYIIALGPKQQHKAQMAITGVDTVVESLAQIPQTLFLTQTAIS